MSAIVPVLCGPLRFRRGNSGALGWQVQASLSWRDFLGSDGDLGQLPPAREGRAMAYLNIRVGDTLAHWYQDDDCWHERRALWRVKEGVWAIYTPDADLYVEDLRGVEDGPSRCKIKGTHFRYWSRVGGPSYKFASPIGEEELKLLTRRGYETARQEDDFDPEWLPDQVVVGDTVRGFDELFGGSFLPRRLKMKQPRRQVNLPLDEGAGVGQTDPGPTCSCGASA